MVLVIDGVVICVLGEVSKLINLFYCYCDMKFDVVLYYVVKFENGVKVIFLENGSGVVWFN